MVTLTLMAQAYGYQGWTEFWGAMLCFYVVFNDFGFPPAQLNGIANLNMIISNQGDVYNPSHPTFGNTYLLTYYSRTCPSSSDSNYFMIDWVYTNSAIYDLRNTFLNCNMNAAGTATVYTQAITYGTCNIQQISPITNLPVCFTTEACKYAQTSFFIGTVWGQVLNFFVCKTRKLSCLTQGVSNTFMFFALTTEIMLVVLISYFKPFYAAFGTRDTIFMHYGVPALPFSILMILIDEVRKYAIRSLPSDEKGKPHWFTRAALW